MVNADTLILFESLDLPCPSATLPRRTGAGPRQEGERATLHRPFSFHRLTNFYHAGSRHLTPLTHVMGVPAVDRLQWWPPQVGRYRGGRIDQRWIFPQRR